MMARPLTPDPSGQDAITIGLINNMPDSALSSTERQFQTLLSAAAGNRRVRVRLFTLPGVPRGEAALAFTHGRYEDIGALWTNEPVDGLIVTGAEPLAANIRDEPYWTSLTGLVEWAGKHTISTVWSCLAAHAAVLHLDGIARRPVGPKLSGVFDCAKSADHALVAGLPVQWRTPHSRYNELPEDALLANEYQILSRSADAGVDLFAKDERSLFLFVQGHPEYDVGALLREYRRDVTRFLTGERDTYPDMPRFYFGPEEAAAFAEFRLRALENPTSDLLPDFPVGGIETTLKHSWRAPAIALYANWVGYLSERKSRRSLPARTVTPQVLSGAR